MIGEDRAAVADHTVDLFLRQVFRGREVRILGGAAIVCARRRVYNCSDNCPSEVCLSEVEPIKLVQPPSGFERATNVGVFKIRLEILCRATGVPGFDAFEKPVDMGLVGHGHPRYSHHSAASCTRVRGS